MRATSPAHLILLDLLNQMGDIFVCILLLTTWNATVYRNTLLLVMTHWITADSAVMFVMLNGIFI
jgi:hypothetical protein